MKKCPRCNYQNKDDAKFCINCGHKFVSTNRCPNCGAAVKPDAKFCINCGQKLTANKVAPSVSNDHHSTVDQNLSTNDYSTDQVEYGQRYADVNHSKSVHRNWIKRYFSASFLLFWIKGDISVNYREVRMNRPNTVLGLIPAGNDIVNVPLSQVSSAEINEQYRIGRFITGVIIALIGLAMLANSAVLGLIFIIIGVGIFANGLVTELEIAQTSGVARHLDVPIYNRQDIELIRSAVNQALNGEEDKKDLSMYFNRKN